MSSRRWIHARSCLGLPSGGEGVSFGTLDSGGLRALHHFWLTFEAPRPRRSASRHCLTCPSRSLSWGQRVGVRAGQTRFC